MKLRNLYSLRKNFTIIGLTGRVGSGCSQMADLLSESDFPKTLKQKLYEPESNIPDQLKLNICINYLKTAQNWIPFKSIKYKDVLLFHLFYESVKDSTTISEAKKLIFNLICQNGTNRVHTGQFNKNRFDVQENKNLQEKLNSILSNDEIWYNFFNSITEPTLNKFLKEICPLDQLYEFYYNYFEGLAYTIFDYLNKEDIIRRTRLVHDLANQLRQFGTVRFVEESNLDVAVYDSIYIVTETINRLIKSYKTKHEFTKIVIDSIKNSLEVAYFKEKFSGFYMCAINKSDNERVSYLKKRLTTLVKDDQIDNAIKDIIVLDNYEYKGGEVNEGHFSAPDIENCIQQSDYHIYHSNHEYGFKEKKEFDYLTISNSYPYLSLRRQIARLIALIHQPGIITPTGNERTMQVAYNAKFNSGCISRQVGAVVTDNNYSIKSIGWNDVPKNQIPCKLRNANDLVNGRNQDHFSDFEKGNCVDHYGDGESFKDKVKLSLDKIIQTDLEGRNCSFCFKTCHNSFEDKKNQVHTRSLHAEENAMLQLTKYGGQGIEKGNLFTTASPCELCSKKAFQLGVKNIYYIDPYPGIATSHILVNGTEADHNPKLLMFQGAVGRTFHKLYESLLSYKDEIKILTKFEPIKKEEKIE